MAQRGQLRRTAPAGGAASAATANTGFPMIGDDAAGRLLQADQYLSTDMGVEPLRQVVLPPLYGGTKRAFCARLEVEMEVGTVHSPPNVVLDWSDDGGITWTGGPRTMLVGSAGGTTGCGSMRRGSAPSASACSGSPRNMR